MAVRQDIKKNDEWFTNTSRNLDFEILDSDPAENADAAPINITAFSMEWNLADSSALNATKLIDSHAVTVTGVYNADRTLNTQRARVGILASETDDILGDKTYYHELRRTGVGLEAVLSFGDAYIWQSPS